MRHGSVRILLIACIVVCPRLLGAARADEFGSPTRATNDRDADLVQALVERARFDDALSICRMLSRGADPEGDAVARWAITQSQILVARQMGMEQFENADVERAAGPITELLTSYPDHRRQLFLLAGVADVHQGAAMHRLLRAAVAPTDAQARDQATTSLLQTNDELEALVKRISEARILLDQQGGVRPFALLDDLARLQQTLQVDSVSLALMQTELFAPGSDDGVAAATRAERIADEAITRLPSDTKARREVERMKIESILRAGQYDRADEQLAVQLAASDPPSDSRWIALRVRIDMAQQRMQQAAARLGDYYGEQPAFAPRSIDMDLARWEYLLRANSGSTPPGDWLDAIQTRGGAYARRRGEAIALSLLGRPDASSMPGIDPAIVAAQGHDYLRRGEPARAAALLAAAAAAERNADRAIARAAEAAAAFESISRHQEAVSVLAETAIANASALQASAAHLQAALLLASSDPTAIGSLESMLQTNLRQWPGGDTAPAAREWLAKLLTGQGRFVDAAEVIIAVPADRLTTDALDAIDRHWLAAFHANAPENSLEMSQRFLDAYQPLLSNPLAAIRFSRLAATLVDRELVGQVAAADGLDQADPFAAALLAYRQGGAVSDSLRTAPPEASTDATQRLMMDGRQDASLRLSIATLLATWEGNDKVSVELAERLIWMGSIADAIRVLDTLVQAQPNEREITTRAAELLDSAGNADAFQEAIRLWDRLAAGAAQGSQLWHDAKLAGIAALRRSRNLEESQRRARYVLLTMPAMEDALRTQYEAFAK